MARTDQTPGRISVDDAREMVVGDVMIAKPKTLPPDALVGDVRHAFEHPKIRTVLLAQEGVFHGAIERGGVPADAAADEPAATYADPRPLTAPPGMPVSEAIALLEHRGEPRLIVLDQDGRTLRGLLCADSGATGFCVR